MGKKILLTSVLLFPVIIGGALVVPSFVDWNAHKAFIEATAKEKTGYDLKLGGDISLSMLPLPYLSVKDVSLYNDGELLSKVEEADVSVELFPLFYGELNLDTVRFKKPEIFFTIGQDGKNNWSNISLTGPEEISKKNEKQNGSSPKAETKISGGSSEIEDFFSLKSVQIHDGRFIYEDKLSGKKHEIKAVYTDLKGDSLSGPYDVTSKLTWQDHDVELTLHSGRISRHEETVPLKFSLSLLKSGAELNYSGVVVPSMPLDIQGELSVKAKDSKAFLSSVGINATYLDGQAFSTTGMLTATDEKVALENLSLSLGGVKWKGKFSSVTSPQKAERKTKASLALDNVTTAKFEKGDGFDFLYFLSDLSVKGDMALEGQTFDFKSLVISNPSQSYSFSGMYKSVEQALLVRDFSAKGLEGDGTVNLKGEVEFLPTLEGLDLTFDLSFQDFERFLTSFGIENTFLKEPVKKLVAQARLTGNEKAVHFDTNVKALEAAVKVSGVVKNPMAQREIGEVSLSVVHPDFVKLVSLFVPAFEPGDAWGKTFSLKSDIQQNNKTLSFSNVRGSVGPTTFKADIATDISSSKADISGAFELGDLVIPGNVKSETGRASAPAEEKKPVPEGAAQKKNGNLRWSRQAIHTGWLHSANLDLDIKAKSVSYDLWHLNGFSTKLKMKNGALELKDFRTGVFDGAVKGNLTLSSGKDTHDPLSVDLQADVENVLLERIMSAILKKKNEMVKGPVSSTLDIRAVGISTAALISDLQGKGTLKGRDITVKGVDLNEIAQALRSDVKLKDNFDDLTQIGKGNTAFDTVSGTFSIDEGVVQTKDLTFDEKRVQMLTVGKVDLPRWALDLVNKVTFKNNKEAPDFDIKLNGSLDNPASTFRDELIKDFLTRKIERKIQKEFENLLSKKLNEKSVKKDTNDNVQQVAPNTQEKREKIEPEDVLKSILQDVIR